MRLVPMLAILGCGRVSFDARSDAPLVAIADVAPDTSVGGPSGTVLRIDGLGSFVQLDSVCAQLPGGRTVTAWVEPNPDQNGTTGGHMFAFNDASGGDNLSLVQWFTDPLMNYYDDFYANPVYIDNSMPAGAWSFVALTIDAAGNGVLYRHMTVAMTFTTPRTVPADGRLSLGQEWDGFTATDFFAGRYDAVSVWNHARTSQQLAYEMQYGVTLSETGLVAHYTFENGLTDSIGMHDGIATGTPTFEPQ